MSNFVYRIIEITIHKSPCGLQRIHNRFYDCGKRAFTQKLDGLKPIKNLIWQLFPSTDFKLSELFTEKFTQKARHDRSRTKKLGKTLWKVADDLRGVINAGGNLLKRSGLS